MGDAGEIHAIGRRVQRITRSSLLRVATVAHLKGFLGLQTELRPAPTLRVRPVGWAHACPCLAISGER